MKITLAMLESKKARNPIIEYFIKHWGVNGNPEHTEMLKQAEIDKWGYINAIIISFKLSGNAKSWSRSGIASESNYKDGNLHGLCRTWYSNGKLESEHNYKNGKLHGLCKGWYDSGVPRYENNFIDDKKHGLCRDWKSTGRLSWKNNFENGVVAKHKMTIGE